MHTFKFPLLLRTSKSYLANTYDIANFLYYLTFNILRNLKFWCYTWNKFYVSKKKSFKQWKQYFWRENQRWRVEVYYIHDILLRDHINIFWFCQADIQACALNSKYITTKNLPGVVIVTVIAAVIVIFWSHWKNCSLLKMV